MQHLQCCDAEGGWCGLKLLCMRQADTEEEGAAEVPGVASTMLQRLLAAAAAREVRPFASAV